MPSETIGPAGPIAGPAPLLVTPRQPEHRWATQQLMARTTEPSKLSDDVIIVRANVLASIAALVSVLMCLTDIRQIGSLAAVVPASALCCGLFGLVFSAWQAFRNTRLLYVLFGLWAVIPVLWTICFLLVIDPASRRV
jgi:hypothetical protein